MSTTAKHMQDSATRRAKCNHKIADTSRLVDRWAKVTCRTCLSWKPHRLATKPSRGGPA